MVQLSDNLFASRSSLMRIEEAIAVATERLEVVAAIESAGLHQADGRIAAGDLFARNEVPSFSNSAVDGYAVRFSDLTPGGPTMLPLQGRVAAGSSDLMTASGCAIRIFTGAPMPFEADTVFMQEDVRLDADQVHLPAGLRAGANTRPVGEDIASGERIIAAGQRLRPQDIALAAATGHRRILVRRPLRVAVFSTGDELVRPGGRLKPGAIYDSNRVMLVALLGRLGAKVLDFGILRDSPKILAERLARASEMSDLILTSGGVSLGEEDHVKAAVETVGQLVFWRLAIKPGRPLAMGMVGSTPFIGLPGNPVAAYVTFAMFVRPLLCHLGGVTPQPPASLRVRSAFARKKRPGRREYLRVNIVQAADGMLDAHAFPKEGSALLTSLTATDGIAALAEDVTDVVVGDLIEFYPHTAFW